MCSKTVRDLKETLQKAYSAEVDEYPSSFPHLIMFLNSISQWQYSFEREINISMFKVGSL